jgi:molybdopterin-binding protein
MNRFTATITSITSKESINQIELSRNGEKIKMLTLKLPPNIAIGLDVNLMCKESEVAVGKSLSQISISNQIRGVIKEIKEGEIISIITIDSRVGTLNSLITTSSLRVMGFQANDEIFALIKANELSMELK